MVNKYIKQQRQLRQQEMRKLLSSIPPEIYAVIAKHCGLIDQQLAVLHTLACTSKAFRITEITYRLIFKQLNYNIYYYLDTNLYHGVDMCLSNGYIVTSDTFFATVCSGSYKYSKLLFPRNPFDIAIYDAYNQIDSQVINITRSKMHHLLPNQAFRKVMNNPPKHGTVETLFREVEKTCPTKHFTVTTLRYRYNEYLKIKKMLFPYYCLIAMFLWVKGLRKLVPFALLCLLVIVMFLLVKWLKNIDPIPLFVLLVGAPYYLGIRAFYIILTNTITLA